MNNILTKHQIDFLKLIGSAPAINKNFYLTGGTALNGFYVPYRYSEDLDFFSENEINIMTIQVFLKKYSSRLNITQIEYQSSFNRNLFFLKFNENDLKIEFTFFPFARLDKGAIYYGVTIDSPLDIATNKLFAIYQRTAARDYMDLYQLCVKFKFTIEKLTANARIKFDTHIDLLKLGAQFNKAASAGDLPRLIKPLPEKSWRNFFIAESKKLKPKIMY